MQQESHPNRYLFISKVVLSYASITYLLDFIQAIPKVLKKKKSYILDFIWLIFLENYEKQTTFSTHHCTQSAAALRLATVPSQMWTSGRGTQRGAERRHRRGKRGGGSARRGGGFELKPDVC